MASTDVTALFGKAFASEEVQAFIEELGVKPKVEVEQDEICYDFKKAGVYMTAEPRSKRINHIFLFADKVDRYTGYKGELPHGIVFGMDLKAVEKLLGTPRRRDDGDEALHWDFGTHNFIVEFDAKGRVKTVIVNG